MQTLESYLPWLFPRISSTLTSAADVLRRRIRMLNKAQMVKSRRGSLV
jgi:hypothetical protein